MLRLSAVLVMLMVTLVSGAPARLRVCGPELADVLALVCKDRGYNGHTWQDSPSPEVLRNGLPEVKGVAEECCHIGCTYSDVEEYCSPRPTSARGEADTPLNQLVQKVRDRRRKGAICSCSEAGRRVQIHDKDEDAIISAKTPDTSQENSALKFYEKETKFQQFLNHH